MWQLRFSRHLPVAYKFVFLMLPLAAVCVLAFSARWSATPGQAAAIVPPPGPAPSATPPPRLEAERVTLNPDGFAPGALTRPAGRFLLALTNRSGADEELQFRLVRETGEVVRAVSLARGRRDLRGALNLPPGHYQLRVAGHPGWVFNLHLTLP
jgi:hypothetical protein